MTAQDEKPPLSAAKYTLKGHVIVPEHKPGIARPQAGGIMGDFRPVEESKDGSQRK